MLCSGDCKQLRVQKQRLKQLEFQEKLRQKLDVGVNQNLPASGSSTPTGTISHTPTGTPGHTLIVTPSHTTASVLSHTTTGTGTSSHILQPVYAVTHFNQYTQSHSDWHIQSHSHLTGTVSYCIMFTHHLQTVSHFNFSLSLSLSDSLSETLS